MKATGFLLNGAILFLAATAWAGPEQIILQRAHELANQNNVRQGVAPPTQQPAPAPGSTAATPSAAITKLKTDLAALKGGDASSAEQQKKVATDLVAAAETAGKPSLAAATTLAADIGAASTDSPLPASSRNRLVQELDAVLNPSRYPLAKLDGIYADIQAIFQANGLSRTKAVQIADEVKTIAGEVRRQ